MRSIYLKTLFICLAAFFFLLPGYLSARNCQNVAGYYKIKSVIGQNTCGEEIDPVNLTGEIIQDGCDVELDIGVSLDGKVVGNKVYLKGSYWYMGSTTKDIQLTIQGRKLSGHGKWTYSFMGYSCKGTETFSGTKE